jgi:hypothetical protein
MSHHYSCPNFDFPPGNACLGLTDLYVLPKPGDARRWISIRHVHPSTPRIKPEPATANHLRSPDSTSSRLTQATMSSMASRVDGTFHAYPQERLSRSCVAIEPWHRSQYALATSPDPDHS